MSPIAAHGGCSLRPLRIYFLLFTSSCPKATTLTVPCIWRGSVVILELQNTPISISIAKRGRCSVVHRENQAGLTPLLGISIQYTGSDQLTGFLAGLTGMVCFYQTIITLLMVEIAHEIRSVFINTARIPVSSTSLVTRQHYIYI